MGVGIEAGEEHVGQRATEGRVSVGLGARVRRDEDGRLSNASQVSQCSL